jgi:hypothetical protein
VKLPRILGLAVVSAALVTLAAVLPATAGTAGASNARQAHAAAAPAAAAQQGGPLGWRRYHYGPFTEPAGTACRFTLRGQTVRQDVWYRTSDRYANGDPRDQVFIGPLYTRYINQATGKSIVGNLSGSASIHYDRDGTQLWYVVGPFGITFHPGNPYHRPGEYILSGLTELDIHHGTMPQIRYHRGPTENVCAALR